jgi:hypothetical protein
LASPWSRAAGVGEVPEIQRHTLERVLRDACLTVVAFTLMAGTWALADQSRDAHGSTGSVAVAGYERESGVPRFRAPAPFDGLTSVTLVIDGIAVATDARAGDTVAGLLRAAGVDVRTGDRLSVPADQPLVAGLRIVLDRGFPVTVVDGGTPLSLRAQPGTVASFLEATGITLGPKDRLEVAAEGPIVPGAVVGIERVTESTVVELVPIAAPVQTIAEPTEYVGWRYVAATGTSGLDRVTFQVRWVNGIETDRTIVAAEPVTAPVPQVVHVGTKYKPAPPPPDEIAAIIRAAAAKYGVDEETLLRVAYCESRYDPLAYNPILGASGLFQIIPGTWAANSVAAGYGGASVWDPVANANVAAWMFSTGKAGLWACK